MSKSHGRFLGISTHGAQPDWQAHVAEGRERWRSRQAAAVVRDVPQEAARVLPELGYTVEPPDPVPSLSVKALRTGSRSGNAGSLSYWSGS
jgi:hypothetical protein